MGFDTNEIKKRISVVDYARRCGIPVYKAGDRCVSPLRPDATNRTSFVVQDEFFYDFGSASWGDVIDLCAQLKHNGDKGKAIRELAEITGVQSDYSDSDGWMEYTKQMNAMTAFYHSKLTAADYDYLHSRGLTDGDIDRLKIGRVTDGSLIGRLFLPYFMNGYVCYYATRAMPGGSYPDSKYRKQTIDNYCQHVPWGLQTLDRGGNTLIIAEGYFDAASFECRGYPVLSAITGHFSKSQMPIVINAARNFKRVLLVYDNDAVSHAGEAFTEKMAKTLMQHKIPFVIGKVPNVYKDVSEFYADGGKLSDIVDNAQDGLAYLCDAFDDLEDLKKFLSPIVRYYSEVRVAKLVDDIAALGNFSRGEIKALEKYLNAPPSESNIADEIIAEYKLIYVPGVGFYEWNGRKWIKIDDLVVQSYADKRYGKRHSTAQRSAQVCKLLKARSYLDVEFDRNPVLTFQNGTLEIETGNFREFSERDYCSFILPYDYDPNAKCTEFVKFIEDVTEEDGKRIENLQFIPGYVLFPDCRHQRVFILHGGEGAGKSIYLEVIRNLFGGQPQVTNIEPTGLTQEFQRVLLKDSLLNIGTEIKTDFTQGSIREWLISIADGTTVQACYKGMTHINFAPRCKLIYACNSIPSAAVAEGLGRRLQFISFPCSYVDNPDPKDPRQKQRDVNLLPRLLKELPGIFNWAYEGYKQLIQFGQFTPTTEQSELIGQFREQSNPMITFLNDCGDQLSGEVPREKVYAIYKDWCDSSGHKQMSNTRFFPALRSTMDAAGLKCEDMGQRRTGGRVVRMIDFGESVTGTTCDSVKELVTEQRKLPIEWQ